MAGHHLWKERNGGDILSGRRLSCGKGEKEAKEVDS
jgi:hypothetical protein